MSNNFGLKVSLPGYSVETAGDQNLYLSSSWPIMKIDESLSATYTIGSNVGSITIAHNLGYPPFTMVFDSVLGYIGPAPTVNSTTLTIDGTSVSGHFYVFRNPLNQNFQAPQLDLSNPPEGTGNEDFGIKFSKPGKDVSSSDLRDFTLHSGTRSLMVYATIYQPIAPLTEAPFVGLYGLEYITDLPYDPIYFAFYSSDGENFRPVFTTGQSAPKVDFGPITGGIIINNGNTSSGFGAFYILLDPYQTTNQVNVTL